MWEACRKYRGMCRIFPIPVVGFLGVILTRFTAGSSSGEVKKGDWNDFDNVMVADAIDGLI